MATAVESGAKKGRGVRRGSVFSTPVTVEADWYPPSYEKSEEERAKIRNVISRNILFQNLDENTKSIIVAAMARRRFSKGDVIIREKDVGDFYYIIDEGKCEIFVAAVGKVLDVKEGDTFGELALMYDAPRAATVVAATEVQTWALDQMTFKKTLKDTTIKKRTMLQDFLKDVPILRLLSEYERLTLTDALQECTYEAGEVIMREGDEGETFCIIESGEVKCTKAGIVGEVCPRLKKGDYFGELALLTSDKRKATVTAVTSTTCQAVDRTTFTRLIGSLKSILETNQEAYAKYMDGIVVDEDCEEEEEKDSDAGSPVIGSRKHK